MFVTGAHECIISLVAYSMYVIPIKIQNNMIDVYDTAVKPCHS